MNEKDVDVYREIGHHQGEIEVLQDQIAYHLGQIALCEQRLVFRNKHQEQHGV